VTRRPRPHYSVGICLAAAMLLLLAIGAFAGMVLSENWAIGPGETVNDMVTLIRSWGAWAVLGSIGLMVAHSFLPFPAEIIACANGMVFGPVWGAVITWVGAMLGASAAFGVVRLLGRPFLERILSPGRRAQMAVWSREYGGRTLLNSRLIAFNLINYAAALTNISWWTFLWATGIGILPLTILLAIMGDRMLTLPAWGWFLVTVAALLLLILVLRNWKRSQRELYAVNGAEVRNNKAIKGSGLEI
jgi:uncharacterized membrane protein YdjX (TVP38/TMEM64 family)